MRGKLASYKNSLLVVGGFGTTQETGSDSLDSSGETELMERKKDGSFIWSVIESSIYSKVEQHSLVTVPPCDTNEEYVLLIGGYNNNNSNYFYNYSEKSWSRDILSTVFKFNGTWSYFGMLNKPRYFHNSIYWNGAVYIIGGEHGDSDEEEKTKIEIWKIQDSQNLFQTSENWPELYDWNLPHLFIVPDSFFPDY